MIEKDSMVELQESIKEFIDSAEEVIIGSEQGTTFPTKVGSTLCNALIDTGATKSCRSESYYRTLQIGHIRSYTAFINDFIVCQNLT